MLMEPGASSYKAARLGFDDLDTAMLRDTIRASTKLDKSTVNSGWRAAKA